MGGPAVAQPQPSRVTGSTKAASGLPTVDDYERLQQVTLCKLEDVETRHRFQEKALAKLKKEIAEWTAEGEGWTYQVKQFELLLKASNSQDAQLVSERGTIESQRKTIGALIECARERESLHLVERAEEVERRLDGHRGSRLTVDEGASN